MPEAINHTYLIPFISLIYEIETDEKAPENLELCLVQPACGVSPGPD